MFTNMRAQRIPETKRSARLKATLQILGRERKGGFLQGGTDGNDVSGDGDELRGGLHQTPLSCFLLVALDSISHHPGFTGDPPWRRINFGGLSNPPL